MDLLYLIYTTTLNHSDYEFWKATPRMIYSQIEKWNEIHCNSSTDTNFNNRTSSKSGMRGDTVRLKAVD